MSNNNYNNNRNHTAKGPTKQTVDLFMKQTQEIKTEPMDIQDKPKPVKILLKSSQARMITLATSY